MEKLKISSIAVCVAALFNITVAVAADNVYTETVNGLEWTYRVVNGEAVLGGNNNARTIDTSTFGAITIPDTLGGYPVRGIGGCAFQDCTALTLITLPINLRYISNDAFRNCSGLMMMSVPDGVKSISARGFYDCGNMTKIVLPNSITNIEHEAFRNCGNLKNVNIPANLTTIADRVFQGCQYPFWALYGG